MRSGGKKALLGAASGQPLGEERLQGGSQCCHRARSWAQRPSRRATRASSSGVDNKYQYVGFGTNGSQSCS
jgi:hypothetical protein